MEPITLVEKHLEHYSAGRWDDYRAALSADVIYDEVATKTRARGVEGYLAAVQRWKRAFPDLVAHVREAYATRDRVFVELEWSGTQRAALEGPFGTIAPTNKRGTLEAVLVFTVAGGRITASRHYFDNLSLLMQLGAIPAGFAKPPEKPAAAPPASRR